MFQSVTVTNFMGDTLELPLKWPNDAGLLISNVEGITPGNVQINSQDYATLDGGVYNSSRMQTRNITIEMYYGFSPQIESARHRAYRYFPVKTEVRLDFLTDERWLSIWGYVESNEVEIFSEHEKGLVSIVCPDPYFYEKEYQSYRVGSYIPEFEFPFSNESLDSPLICFSDYGTNQIYRVDYDGDMEVGAIIRIHFMRSPRAKEFIIYDVSHGRKLILNFDDLLSKTPVTSFSNNGEIVFNSVRGQKGIWYEEYGNRISLLGAFDISKIPWMLLTPGENIYGFGTDEQYATDFQMTVEHRGAYGGV